MRPLLNSVKLIKAGVGDFPEQIMAAGKSDVLISICLKRYTRETLQITKRFREKGVKVIAVTNDPLSGIGQVADIPLIVKTDILSYAAPMSLMNAFIDAIIIKNKRKFLSAIKRHERELAEFETYID